MYSRCLFMWCFCVIKSYVLLIFFIRLILCSRILILLGISFKKYFMVSMFVSSLVNSISRAISSVLSVYLFVSFTVPLASVVLIFSSLSRIPYAAFWFLYFSFSCSWISSSLLESSKSLFHRFSALSISSSMMRNESFAINSSICLIVSWIIVWSTWWSNIVRSLMVIYLKLKLIVFIILFSSYSLTIFFAIISIIIYTVYLRLSIICFSILFPMPYITIYHIWIKFFIAIP